MKKLNEDQKTLESMLSKIEKKYPGIAKHIKNNIRINHTHKTIEYVGDDNVLESLVSEIEIVD